LGYYYEVIEKNYDEMKKYYLMAIELKHPQSMFRLEQYNEMLKKFNVIDLQVCCPITLEETNKCFEIKNCKHQFSKAILQCDKCPLCRREIE